MKKTKLNILSFLIFISYASFYGQNIDAKEILVKAQQSMDAENFSFESTYSLYPTYSSNNIIEEYGGKTMKRDKSLYSKINKTIFFTDTEKKVSLKLNENQKMILFSNSKKKVLKNDTPMDILDVFIKSFKKFEVKDLGGQWLCSLTSDYFTQLPYGRVDIYVSKIDNIVTKQVLFFLAQNTYKDSKGETKIGNPRLEISLKNFKKTIDSNDINQTKISHYLTEENDKVQLSKKYKDYKVIKTK